MMRYDYPCNSHTLLLKLFILEIRVPRAFCHWDNMVPFLCEVDFQNFQWHFMEIIRLLCLPSLFICLMLGLFISCLLRDHNVCHWDKMVFLLKIGYQATFKALFLGVFIHRIY